MCNICVCGAKDGYPHMKSCPWPYYGSSSGELLKWITACDLWLTLRRGDQIAYVPDHAKGDINHPDVQFGFVTSKPHGGAFCRYWNKYGELRTKANSELTPIVNIVRHDSVGQLLVEAALKEYC